ncbi:hypothetical protein [Acetobacter sp. AAB5]|uniref:hypothetical protein n=1 Tax=Acetobacter sp. AAB5 TaxID=3418370 RepID=UPI003CFBBD46
MNHIAPSLSPLDSEFSGTALDDGRTDGATSIDGLVSGSYLHGLFTDSEQRAAWLTRLGLPSSFQNYTGTIDEALNNIAMEIERHVNMKAIIDIAMSFGKN